MIVATLSLTLLTFLPWAPPSVPTTPTLVPQEQESTDTTEHQPPAPEVFYYTGRNRDASWLYSAAVPIFSGAVPKADGAGYTTSLQLLGEHRILIYDTPTSAERVLAFLRELDTPEEVAEIAPDVDLETIEYFPRYLSITDIARTLDDFDTRLADRTHSITILSDSNRVLLRGDEDFLARMKTRLARFDTPSPQVQFSCYVLRAAPSEGEDTPSPSLPSGITENLAKLVPYDTFSTASFGTLRTTASASSRVTLQMSGEDEAFDLTLILGAYSRENSALTLQLCDMSRSRLRGDMLVPDSEQRLFTLSTTLQGGEYAVLGATGKEPIFVVLWFTPLGN